MPFITKDFLLQNETARHLYYTYAADLPILDYHCHLSPKDIADDRRFSNLFETWLEGDHYKWRAMRANGIAERYCTGDADPYEKFLAWARTVPYTLRNPLYQWAHLELKRYFDIDELLDERTAPRIWEQAKARLLGDDLSAQGILRKFQVTVLCTTDDPTDSLEHHLRLQAADLPFRVLPAFRPDRAFRTEDPGAFNDWVDKLAARTNVEISRLADLLQSLRKRHEEFHQLGCRLSDHGLDSCYAESCSEREAESIFKTVRRGARVSESETLKLASFLLLFFGHLDAEKGWTKQLHLGAYRGVNTRMLQKVGPDTGFDSIGDWPQAQALVRYLDRLDQANRLPKMIVYNSNPADDYLFAALVGNYQDDSVPGKVQFGSAWWFLDQKEGMEWQLNALSNCGLLSRFVGMITDSRSFMSFPRHEYFRRLLCNLLGGEMEAGLLPRDETLIGTLIRNICYQNAVNYFAFPAINAGAEAPAVASLR
jgi:glucuronate isomerase